MVLAPGSNHASRRPDLLGSIGGAALAFGLAGAIFASAMTILLDARCALAHGKSVSYSSWEIDPQGADVSLRLSMLELSRLGPDALPPETFERGAAPERRAPSDVYAERFASELVLSAGESACPPIGPIRRHAERSGWVRYAWRVDCPTRSARLAIRSRVLQDVAPSHLHFARARFAGSPETVRERVLTEAAPTFVVRSAGGEGIGEGSDFGDDGTDGATDSGGSRFRDYLKLGVVHILSGWDHLAFLFGLMLLAERPAAIARLVTGFTLAHSLTLALTVQGLVHPRAAAVEAMIAFSVALVAVEKGWLVSGRRTAIPIAVLVGLSGVACAAAVGASTLSLSSVLGLILFTACYFAMAARSDRDWTRIALTFAFGLVHGFGFAGVLVELDLPPGRLVPALAGFNVGVELGQLAVVALAWPALSMAARLTPIGTRQWARDLALAGLCGLGCFWLYDRAFAF
jgi:hypothetical protein